ncbi:peptidyl-alpha-hydroxyglycine alpha-amidating lyase family protein [uncultured Endozoicomonas sp.]|uniref:peptidyl-alpha-hydroxyglycine alpha-amidating lyase family protein n=1 Tax=uncultured Endozoicomonas sp. TaxID=432652 RepID=UPI002636A371|nr:peptidyl-alpha-hydroxyglycine alpha-amidating lyase family protein [uncultured Endozoicomonas sp.]
MLKQFKKIQITVIALITAIIIGAAFSWKKVSIVETEMIPGHDNGWLEPLSIISANTPLIGEGSGVDIGPNGNIFFLHRAGYSFTNNQIINQDVVVIYSGKTGEILNTWGSGIFKSPHGITISNNTVWITDIMLNKVFKLNLDGSIIQIFGNDYPFYLEACLRIRNKFKKLPCTGTAPWYARPTDVEVYADGSFVVADGYRNSRLVKHNPDGSVSWEVGTIGQNDGEFHLPHGLAKDDQGNLYVADRRNARIQVFDSTGKWLATWSDKAIGRPYGLDFFEDHIWVVDAGDSHEFRGGKERSQILKLTREGQIVNRYSSFGGQLGELNLPHDIAIGISKKVFVAEIMNKRLHEFSEINNH